jgi:RES domain-containing protein
VIVYRICQTYPPRFDPIDGMGAFKNGGRWNSKGVHAVYTASSLALARCELARHVNLESIPDDFSVYEIEIPDRNYRQLENIPEDWRKDPPSRSTSDLGDKELQNPDVLAFYVPSVCDPNSFNFIINPTSVHFGKVKVLQYYPFVV